MLGEATGLVRWVAIALLVAASIGISISHARAQKKAQEDGTLEDADHTCRVRWCTRWILRADGD